MTRLLPILAALALTAPGCLAFHGEPLPGPPADATFTFVGDTHVRYLDAPVPEGTPERGTVVFVHGYGASLNEWLGVIAAVRRAGFRAVALDLRGHGWTSRPDGDYSVPGQAQLVLSLLEQLGVDRFALVGHSWGSAVSLEVVTRARERVSRVALYNGMLYDAQEPVVFAWARAPVLGEIIYGVFYPERADEKLAFAFYDHERFLTEEGIAQLDGLMDRPGTQAAALAVIRQLDLAPLERAYPTITQPVLLLWGREDQVTPLEWGERLANTLPDSRLVVFPRCGHVPMLEAATPSTRELLRFLEDGVAEAQR